VAKFAVTGHRDISLRKRAAGKKDEGWNDQAAHRVLSKLYAA
jgi:hypothetical protein